MSSNISEVLVKMSAADEETKSTCLAAVSKILNQLGCLVATKLSSSDPSYKSSFYNLYYDDDESVHSNSSEEEESVHSNSSEEEENVHSNAIDEKDVFLDRMVSFINSQESHVICPTKSKVSCNLKHSFKNQNICIGGPPKKFWRP